MRKLLLFTVTVLLACVGYSQDSVVITEQYAGVIYTHELSTNDFETNKTINPRLGLNVRYPFMGYLYTRVIYDLPDHPFGHLTWEVPICVRGWSGVRLLAGFQPRLAGLIKPSPLTIDAHNETAAMASVPGPTYALRFEIKDSTNMETRTQLLTGVYRDTQHKLGGEVAGLLYLGSTRIGATGFFDSQVNGVASYLDSDIGNGFIMINTNKQWQLQNIAGSFQLTETLVGDPYVDIVWNNEPNGIATAEFGTFIGFEFPNEHNTELGVAYEFVEEIVKVFMVFYW